MSSRRGVGYCMNSACGDMAKGVFLLNHSSMFWCARCRVEGFIETEVGSWTGDKELPFKQVRVYFDHDARLRTYRGMAIVRDESIWGPGRVYVLSSPLIRTDKRALKMAESILASVTRREPDMSDSIPRQNETVLDLEARDFTPRLKQLEIDLTRRSV